MSALPATDTGTDPSAKHGIASLNDTGRYTMEIMKSAALAALLSCSVLASVTPAFATNISPVQGATGTPQQVCEDLLRPAAPSGFTTTAINVVAGDWVNVGAAVDLGAFGPIVGIGTPTAGPIQFDISKSYRNGGSPNVWGVGRSTLTYQEGSRQQHHFKQAQSRTTSFDCRVTKNPADGPNDPAGQEPQGPEVIMPPGLQTTGNTTVETRDFLYDEWVVNSSPYTIPGDVQVSTLICISPNNTTKGKPGDWVQKHGFTGSCTEASRIAGTNFIPSHNNPTTDPDTKF